MKTKANYINHEIIILDASTSMAVSGHTQNVIKVTDALISHLASQVSVFPDQETRITVYAFSSEEYMDGSYYQCLIWDKDVLRVPSIAGLYHPRGNTALCDTMLTVIGDVKQIPVMYGDHAVLVYLVTDGEENHSRKGSILTLPTVISELPETWTIAGLVPSVRARESLIRFGFPHGNVEIWDPSRRDGIEEVGRKIKMSSESFHAARSFGLRSTDKLFTMAEPSKEDLKRTLTPMTEGSYYFEPVTDEDLSKVVNGRIDQFMQLKTGKPYAPGSPVTFYQMDSRVRIQQNKRIAVAIPDHGKKSVQVYTGAVARTKLGLPDDRDVRVSPGRWKDYKVFVETTSFNRKLHAGTSVLVMR